MKKQPFRSDGAESVGKTQRLTLCALLVSLSLVFSYIEHIIPFDLGIPGIKLGLANVAVIMVLYLFGAKDAFVVSLLRIFISFLLFGSIYSLAYSLAGGVLSFALMLLMKKLRAFSIVGVSICGGIVHNVAQLAVAVIVLGSVSIALYLPVLLISGAITGAIIGVLAQLVISKIKKIS